MADPRRQTRIWKITIWSTISAAVVWSLFPFSWMLSTGLKTELDIYKMPPDFWPSNITFENIAAISAGDWKRLWRRSSFTPGNGRCFRAAGSIVSSLRRRVCHPE